MSALNPFKSLEELQDKAVETLDLSVGLMIARSDLNLDYCLKHAIEFVRVTSDALFVQLKAAKLGEYGRALSIGQEYGQRLLQRYTGRSEDASKDIARKLVFEYPSHEYIIDHYELAEMGFDVELFADGERDAVEGLIYDHCMKRQTVIQCVEPSSTPAIIPPPTVDRP